MEPSENNNKKENQNPNIALLIIGIIIAAMGIYHMTQGTQRALDSNTNKSNNIVYNYTYTIEL